MATVGTPGAIRAVPATAGAYGQGVTYPIAYDTSGRLRLSFGVTSVYESLKSIIMTQPGERAMQPDYGAQALLFEPLEVDRLLVKIQEVVSDHESRIASVDDIKIRVGNNGGEAIIDVTVRLKGDPDQRILTYPYFVGPS